MKKVVARGKQSEYGFLFRSKDRHELTVKTVVPVLQQNGIDVLWVDDSETLAALNLTEDCSGVALREIHIGLHAGAIESFTHGIRWLIKEGYKFIGHVENDILCEDGWFENMLSAWQTASDDGLNVGCVSARANNNCTLVPRDGYAVMADVGCGIFMYSLEAILQVLMDKNNPVAVQKKFLISHMNEVLLAVTGLEHPIMAQAREWEKVTVEPEGGYNWWLSNDWLWAILILQHGLVTVAPTPGCARNIDEAGAIGSNPVTVRTFADAGFDFEGFKERLRRRIV